ncbi:MAG: RagB/SusD family nutrient uptake outer membrane protein [Bacteroidetes bacterium]|nr:RagB/SusD family nutrient uptake outer membrane protein [Bacteroidota bacterium]
MKVDIKKSVLLITIIILSGCQSFLDKNPQGSLTQASFPTTANDALLVTNAAYATMRNWYYNSGGYPLLDIMSDDARKGSNPADQLPTVGPYDNFTMNTTQDGLDRWWSSLYQSVRATNVVINYVPKISMDANLKAQYLAEASFLRALFYFDLVRAWGNVPMVTAEPAPLDLKQSTADDIYSLIISDLTTAIQGLPEKSSYSQTDYGRATKGAAKALLAKVYLFKHDYANASSYALEVINSGQYSLEPDFNDANGQNGYYGPESIFEIGALPVEDTNAGGSQYANTQGIRGSPNRGWGFNRPTIDLRDSFEPNDPRMDATIIFLGEVLDGVTTLGDNTTPDQIYDGNNNLIEIECYSQKIWVPGISTTTEWGYHKRLIRYADVLLIAAESLNESGQASQALTYLNQVRARARGGSNSILPDVTSTDMNTLRAAILNERRHELALEGHRFWDLVRTGNAATILGPLGFVPGKHELLPIPQTQIDISKGSLIQNPGW